MILSTSDRDAIRQRCEQATGEKWEARLHRRSDDPNEHDEWLVDFGAGEDSTLLAQTDAEFIAHAREDIPRLLEALAIVEQQREQLKIAMVYLRAAFDATANDLQSSAVLRNAVANALTAWLATGATPEDPAVAERDAWEKREELRVSPKARVTAVTAHGS